MDDTLTELVTGWKQGRVPLKRARDAVLTMAYEFLRRRHRRDEDEVSEFLIEFHDKIEGMMQRFRPQGLPFRHFLLRSLTWQWKTYQSTQVRQAREEEALGQWATTELKEDLVAEPDEAMWQSGGVLPDDLAKSLALLVFKTWAELSPEAVEQVAIRSGLDLAWIQATAARIEVIIADRKERLQDVLKKLAEAHLRRVMAEQELQNEADPSKRAQCEHRAAWYRERFRSLLARRASLRVAPTHQELARLLGMPKGTIDSRLHHLKKAALSVYRGAHENAASGNEQRAQGSRVPSDLSPVDD